MNGAIQEAREQYFFNNSQNRRLRRAMAKKLGAMKQGWQKVKDEFPPYNQPFNVGINEFKRAGHSKKEVVEYKEKARAAFINNNKEANHG